MQIPDGQPLSDLAARERALATRRRTLARLRPPPRHTTAEALLSGAARLLSRRDVRAGAGVICALGIATLILTEATRRR